MPVGPCPPADRAADPRAFEDWRTTLRVRYRYHLLRRRAVERELAAAQEAAAWRPTRENRELVTRLAQLVDLSHRWERKTEADWLAVAPPALAAFVRQGRALEEERRELVDPAMAVPAEGPTGNALSEAEMGVIRQVTVTHGFDPTTPNPETHE
jgi:hypothetical protein